MTDTAHYTSLRAARRHGQGDGWWWREWAEACPRRWLRGHDTRHQGGRTRSGGDHRQLAEHLCLGLVERGVRLVAAATAAVAAAGTSLQFGKRLHAIGRFAADVMVGDGIAQADVHGAYMNANANDCQQAGLYPHVDCAVFQLSGKLSSPVKTLTISVPTG